MNIMVVIPTYNEVENLPRLVSALLSLPLELSILVVDDNSPDGTGRIADDLTVKFPSKIEVMHRPEKTGLRSAYVNGFQKILAGDSQAVAQMDADFSHDPTALIEMVRKLETCDMVLGSRYIDGGSVDKSWPQWRKGLSAFGNWYARTILGLPFRDVTTGYRLWRRKTLTQIPFERISSSGYVFLVEMAYLAHILEFEIGESPIYFADRRWGTSKMSVRIQIEAALRIWKVRWDNRDLRRAGRAGRV